MTRRSESRRGRRPSGPKVTQLPWRRLTNPYDPVEILSADQIEAIHQTSLRVLEELGVEFLSETALAQLKAAGAIA